MNKGSIMGHYFEFKDAKSNKFWEISASGKKIKIHYGKIGTAGQVLDKEFSNAKDALIEMEKAISKKLKEGYIEKNNLLQKSQVKTPKISANKKEAHQLIFETDTEQWLRKEITKQQYNDYLKNGISSSEFEELENDLLSTDWDDYFIKGGSSNTYRDFRIDDESLDGFEKLFAQLYKKASLSHKKENSKLILTKCDYMIVYTGFNRNSTYKLDITAPFDIDSFNVEISQKYIGLNKKNPIETFVPSYDNAEFDIEERGDPRDGDWFLCDQKGNLDLLEIKQSDNEDYQEIEEEVINNEAADKECSGCGWFGSPSECNLDKSKTKLLCPDCKLPVKTMD